MKGDHIKMDNVFNFMQLNMRSGRRGWSAIVVPVTSTPSTKCLQLYKQCIKISQTMCQSVN